MTEREMITVGCRIPSGLTLHISERKPNAGGEAILRYIGTITLNGFDRKTYGSSTVEQTESFTQVDKEWFNLWFEENKQGSVVTSGSVFVSAPATPAVEDDDREKRSGKPGDAQPKGAKKD